jgi:hypothetical protein
MMMQRSVHSPPSSCNSSSQRREGVCGEGEGEGGEGSLLPSGSRSLLNF